MIEIGAQRIDDDSLLSRAASAAMPLEWGAKTGLMVLQVSAMPAYSTFILS